MSQRSEDGVSIFSQAQLERETRSQTTKSIEEGYIEDLIAVDLPDTKFPANASFRSHRENVQRVGDASSFYGGNLDRDYGSSSSDSEVDGSDSIQQTRHFTAPETHAPSLSLPLTQPSIASVMSAVSPERSRNGEPAHINVDTSHSNDSALWEKRKQVAKLLMGSSLHKKDVNRFAVATLPEETPRFEISTGNNDVDDIVLLKVSTVKNIGVALKWYVEHECKMDMVDAKIKGLPNTLPQVSDGHIIVELVEKANGVPEWTVITEGKGQDALPQDQGPPEDQLREFRTSTISTIAEEDEDGASDSGTGTFKRNQVENPSLDRFQGVRPSPISLNTSQQARKFSPTSPKQFGGISGSSVHSLRSDSDELSSGGVYQKARRYSALASATVEDDVEHTLHDMALHSQPATPVTPHSIKFAELNVRSDMVQSTTQPAITTPTQSNQAHISSSLGSDALARDLTGLKYQRDQLANGIGSLQAQIQQDWEDLKQQQKALYTTAHAVRSELEAQRVKLQNEAAERQNRAFELADRVAKLNYEREEEDARVAREKDRLAIAQVQLNHAREERAKMQSNAKSVITERAHEEAILRQEEEHRRQQLAQEELRTQAKLNASRLEADAIEASTASLLAEQHQEHVRIQQLQATLQRATDAATSEQRGLLTGIETALDVHKREAAQTSAKIQAAQEQIQRERARQISELQALESDRTALQSQNAAQLQLRQQLLADAKKLDQEEAQIIAAETEHLHERERITKAYDAIRREQEQLRRDQKELALAQGGLLRQQSELVANSEIERARMLLKQKEVMLEERRLQADTQSQLNRQQEQELSLHKQRLSTQLVHQHEIDDKARETQREAEAAAQRQHMQDVNNVLHAASSSAIAMKGMTPFSRRDLILDQTPFDSTQRERLVTQLESTSIKAQADPDVPNWLSPQLPILDEAPVSLSAPAVVQRKRRRRKEKKAQSAKEANSRYLPRKINNEKDLLAFGIEMDRLLEASTYKAVHDYEGSAPDEISFKKGDTVLLLEKTEQHWRDDSNWLKGMCKGVSGYFPANRVVPLNAVLAAADHSPNHNSDDNENKSELTKLLDVEQEREPDRSHMTPEELALDDSRRYLEAQKKLLAVTREAREKTDATAAIVAEMEELESRNPQLQAVIGVPRLSIENRDGNLDTQQEDGDVESHEMRRSASDTVSHNGSSLANKFGFEGSIDRDHSSLGADSTTETIDQVLEEHATGFTTETIDQVAEEHATDVTQAKYDTDYFDDGSTRSLDHLNIEAHIEDPAVTAPARSLRSAQEEYDVTMTDRVCADFLAWKGNQKREKREWMKKQDGTLSSEWDLWRFLCYHVAEHPNFEHVILIVIIANTVTLAMYDPLADDFYGRNLALNYIEVAFLAVYIIEFIVRVSAYGFAYRIRMLNKSYLQDYWNWIDLVVIIAGIVESTLFLLNSSPIFSLAALRVFRVLRAVKVANNVTHLRTVIDTIAYSMVPLASFLMICVVVIFMYVTIGLAFYMDKLDRACYFPVNGTQASVRPCGNGTDARHCPDNQICYAKLDLPDNFDEMQIVFDGVFSFNNAGLGFYTVFTVITTEGWSQIMYALDDAVGPNYNWIFFVSLVLFGAFALVNVIRGIVAGAYSKIASLEENAKQDSASQTIVDDHGAGIWKAYDSANTGYIEKAISSSSRTIVPRSSLLERSIRPPSAYNSAQIMKIVKSYPFSALLVTTIVTNGVFLGLDAYPQSNAWEDMLRQANFIFVGVYCFEFLLKLAGYGIKGYFRRYLNQLDFLVVAASIIDIVLVEHYEIDSPTSLGALKAFRLLRIFKIAAYWKEFREYFAGFILSFGSTFSLFAVLALYVFVVALSGKEIFGGKISTRTNYNDFGSSMIAAFQLLTVEDFNLMIHDGIVGSGGADGSGASAGIFFVLAVVLGDMILLSVLLALVVDSMSKYRPRSQPKVLTKDDVTAGRYLEGHVEDKSIVDKMSFGCLGPTNSIRVGCHKLMWWSAFEWFILFAILGSCVTLAVEDYRNPNNPRNEVLIYFDIAFVGIFGFEMIVKMIALGLIFHPRAYFTSGWNWLDFMVVVISTLGIVLHFEYCGNNDGLVTILVIRALRVFRAMRIIEFSETLKNASRTIIVAMTRIGVLLMIGVVLIYCFAVVGVSLFKGEFHSCSIESFHTRDTCIAGNGQWENRYLNFDNVGEASLTLVTMIQMEQWTRVFHASADATGVDTGPELNANKGAIWYYVVFLVIVCLFYMAVLLGFVAVVYTEQSRIMYLNVGMTKQQVACIRYALGVPLKRDPYESRRHWGLFKALSTDTFDGLMVGVVILNAVALLLTHSDQSDVMTDALWLANLAFVAIYCIEFVLKILTFGVINYFSSRWNDLDFVVVVAGIIELALLETAYATVFRAFRVVRLVKIIHHGRFRAMLTAFHESLKATVWILLLVLVVFFIYAVIGMQLFARLSHVPGSTINERNNFETLPDALLLLFRVSTGGSVGEIMDDCHLSEPACDLNHPDGSTCGSVGAIPYFVSFILLVAVLLMALFVAIFIEQFDFMVLDKAVLTPYHVLEFVEAWKRQDTDATGKIHHRQLAALLRELEPPIGLGSKAPISTEDKLMSRLPVGIDGTGYVRFRPTMVALIREQSNLWSELELKDIAPLLVFIAPGASQKNLDEVLYDHNDSTIISVRALYKIRRLQRIFRAGLKQKHLRNQVAYLEAQVEQLKVAHDLATASWGMNPGPKATAARDVAQRNIQQMQLRLNVLRHRATPHLRLASRLSHVQADFGRFQASLLQAKVKSQKTKNHSEDQQVERVTVSDDFGPTRPPNPEYVPPPSPTHMQSPGRSVRAISTAVAQPYRRTMVNAAFSPSVASGWNPAALSNGAFSATTQHAATAVVPSSPYLDVSAQVPPSQQWRRFLSAGNISVADIYHGPPPPAAHVNLNQAPNTPARPDDPNLLQQRAIKQHLAYFS